MNIRYVVWIALLGGFTWFAPLDAHAAGIEITVTPSPNDIFVSIRVRRHRWERIQSQGWRLVARTWSRGRSGWRQKSSDFMTQRKWTKTLNRAEICKNVIGERRFAVQVEINHRKWWWHRALRRWVVHRISVAEHIASIRCADIPNDLPPGSPPVSDQAPPPAPPPSQVPPSGSPEESAPPPAPAPAPAPTPEPAPAPTPEPAPQPAPTPPEQPAPTIQPVPQVLFVPDGMFFRFHRAMIAQGFDRNRLNLLRDWTSRLNGLLLKSRQVRNILRTFSFDSARIRAAARASRFVRRPVYAHQIRRIMKTFSFDRDKLHAATFYCKGMADPLNIQLMADTLSFSRFKRKLMERCR